MAKLDGLNEFADAGDMTHLTDATPPLPKVWSRSWAAAFLVALAECGNVKLSATAVGISRQVAHEFRRLNAEFAAAWAEAVALGNEALEDEARRRAVDGWEEPVFFNGSVCGAVRKYDSRLLVVLLGATNPKKFRTNVAMQHSGDPEGEPVKIQITMPDNGRD